MFGMLVSIQCILNFESIITLITISYGFLVNGSKVYHMIQNFHHINYSHISIHHVWISCENKIILIAEIATTLITIIIHFFHVSENLIVITLLSKTAHLSQ